MRSVLVGRDQEMAVLRSNLADARTGTSSVLVLEGDPGIGKSALLAEARQAAEGVVLSTVGVETESDIAYVNLADVFRHHYSYLKSIPDRQADALASVFAIGPSKPADRFTVAAGNEVDMLPVDRRADRSPEQSGGSAQPQDLALDRADRRTRVIR